MDNEFSKYLNNLRKRANSNRFQRKRINYDMNRSLQILEAIGLGHNNNFDINIHIENYKKMIQYFMADEKFEGNLNAGLLLKGIPGTGKTFAFFIFQQFLLELGVTKVYNSEKNNVGFSLKRCKEIVSDFESEKNGGENSLKKYKTSDKIICLDDLGEEIKDGKLAIHYNTECNVIENIFTARYENFLKFGTITHATTNYTFVSDTTQGKKFFFKEFYGIRVEDRMNEMFNVITFKGSSLRKKNGIN